MAIGIGSWLLLAFGAVIATGQGDRADLLKTLERFLFNKTLVAKVTFPAWKDGIDVKSDGTWDARWATRTIKDHGVGIEPGDRVSVTAVKLKDKVIEIHLNGGGAGTMMDVLMTSDAKKKGREASGGKLPGGSRINLKFDRPIRDEDIADLSRLALYLEPVVDTTSLRQDALKAAIPVEYREAASQYRIMEGMDKATVFAIMGEPKTKNIDMNSDFPVEKWVYELASLKTRLVTFKAGRVVKVDEF